MNNYVKSDYIHTTVMINDVTLDMILDTGSKVTLIDFDTYQANFSDCKLYLLILICQLLTKG